MGGHRRTLSYKKEAMMEETMKELDEVVSSRVARMVLGVCEATFSRIVKLTDLKPKKVVPATGGAIPAKLWLVRDLLVAKVAYEKLKRETSLAASKKRLETMGYVGAGRAAEVERLREAVEKDGAHAARLKAALEKVALEKLEVKRISDTERLRRLRQAKREERAAERAVMAKAHLAEISRQP
jgi:hypothetical protein